MNSEVFVTMDDGLFDVWYTVRGAKSKVDAWADQLLERYPTSVYGTHMANSNILDLELHVVEEEWHRSRLPIGERDGKGRT